MRTRIKICGITNRVDAVFCSAMGIDAIGLVFHPSSPRNVTAKQAGDIVRSLAPFTSIVGLFMNADQEFVDRVRQQVHLDILQFHGQESADFCEQFDMPYIKAIAMGDSNQDIDALGDEYSNASALLLDSHRADCAGGSGRTFDWAEVPQNTDKAIIVAGGLTPDNVQLAIAETRPYAVDCSSGVESKPGVKSHQKIREFVENVASA